MRYNFKEQRPDFYNNREDDSVDIESLKELIEDNYPNQQELFESVNYNPYDYMYKRLYDSITNEKEKTGIIELMLEYSPLRNILIDYNSTIVGLPSLDLDWIKADSEQSFNKLDNTQSNFKKICYLFFCETEQDFWDYFAIGYGDTKEMYYYYKEDEFYEGSTLEVAKSREFLLYVYYRTLYLEEETLSKKVTRGITDKERKRRVSIVIRSRKEALKLLMDDYDLSDYHDAQMAWDSQILEIRQEFVKEDNLPMLKKIFISEYFANQYTRVDNSGNLYTIGEIQGTLILVNDNRIKTIGQQAFSKQRNLKQIILPNSLIEIGEGAFECCTSLLNLELNEGLKHIGDQAFWGCYELEEITIPSSVVSIGERAFSCCSGLESIRVERGNTIYDSRGNCSAIIESASNTLILGCKNTKIPQDVLHVGDNAFSGCKDLEKIIIPKNVISIGTRAFSGCNNLSEVKVSMICPLDIDENTFTNRANATLYVPRGGKTNYEQAGIWNEFKAILEYS